ncbi:UDP-N-acetylmuramoyl-tripeptide--D-alanyl-D-alanine ligase [Novosphingobium panipatense]|uniref:UDP-N-acetylmuramoyl-tripeptide--D-alanyl-D-alanine ligase n=2 Tax=Novosphingobium panipatense TaxID=428991 RepID=A0ABY1QVB7_9SPHN|nr:Mur ligase family protein [Novosphingobium panipatense]SMP81827.1 UDP-N-acetylmuramoyl-tripeptide--D-alanyl-D-alanine ligase [Novosphingobium panipatense]
MSDRFSALRAAAAHIRPVVTDAGALFVLFFSWTDGSRQATVITSTAASLDDAWQQGIECVEASGVEPRWLRLDWIDAFEPSHWGAVRQQLSRIKRNYFRLGLSLSPDFRHAFLETELNANAMLYGGAQESNAVLNENNFRIYARKRHGLEQVDFGDQAPIWLFTTSGLFVDEGGELHRIQGGGGLEAGRRVVERLDAHQVLRLIIAGSTYLAMQVQEDGRFNYGWHPCFDRPIPAYNSLRHASTLYAMLEAWSVTRDAVLKAAIDRALRCLTETLIARLSLPDGCEAAFLVDTGAEIKLGGNAVAVLALCKHAELTGDRQHVLLMEALAEGILYMQDKESGRFTHVLAYPGLQVKQDFRIIYYDGEAAFSLMRLYAFSGNARWLAAVERAFEHFLRAEHWKAHDHWLGYCVDELTRYRPKERYYCIGLDNVRDYLDFVANRVTTFPTLLELMTAAEKMLCRLQRDARCRQLLDDFDVALFYKALHRRARHLLNGHFWPELAMFYRNPARIVGSFFIRHHAFRVRIDDVEHYLSGLVAYRQHLLDAAGREGAALLEQSARHWRAADVARATGGIWTVPPEAGWTAQGLCIFGPTMRPGEMVVAAPDTTGKGVKPRQIRKLASSPAAVITQDAGDAKSLGAPVLQVKDTGDAILSLGRYARERMSGKVVAVTGTAGKTTTVAMLAQALSAFGTVGQTRFNANLPHGVAWNLASVPWDAPHTVLELAIGRMEQNARLASPDIAIFTNILPAHLEYHRDLATIAARKSRIFSGMKPGGIAILNRDMAEWHHVQLQARSRGLDVFNYGRCADADFRLIDYDPAARRVVADIRGCPVEYTLGAGGEHMALNSLATLSAVSLLGRDISAAIAALQTFKPVAGRGSEMRLQLNGRNIHLIDETYNASPGSMEAAFALLGTTPTKGRRIAVLGEMLELGPDAPEYHTQLAASCVKNRIDEIYTLGDLFDGFWKNLPPGARGGRPKSLDVLKAMLNTQIEEGDVILLKGSHATRLYDVANWFVERGQPHTGSC